MNGDSLMTLLGLINLLNRSLFSALDAVEMRDAYMSTSSGGRELIFIGDCMLEI